MIRHLIPAIAALIVCSASACAAEILPPSITVNGAGRVFARPDMAEINIGVATQAPTAVAALNANTAAMNNLIASLKSNGIEDKDILTSNFSVNPEYQSYEGSVPRPPKIVRYRVDNSVQVKVRNLDRLGPLLDAVVQSGANNINGISFSVAAPDPLLDQARIKAVADAKRKAELYAGAAGIKVGKVLYINESAGIAPPVPKFFAAEAMQARDASVPIATGEQEMSASVQVIYAIEP